MSSPPLCPEYKCRATWAPEVARVDRLKRRRVAKTWKARAVPLRSSWAIYTSRNTLKRVPKT
jgi:hypothetical protein